MQIVFHMVQLMALHPQTPSSLAFCKSRLLLRSWYRLIQVVLEKISSSSLAVAGFFLARDDMLAWYMLCPSVRLFFCPTAGAGLEGVTRVTSHPPDAAAYFTLLLCVWLKLFRCCFVPLLEPNPGDATAPRSYVQLLYRPDYSQWPIRTVKSDCVWYLIMPTS